MRPPVLLACAAALALAPALALAGEAKSKEGSTPASSYMTLPALNTSVAKRTGGRTLMTLEVGLDIPDPVLNAQATVSKPRLIAAYLEALQAYGASLAPGAVPNVDFLGQKLQQSTDRTLGKPGARLLIGSVVVN